MNFADRFRSRYPKEAFSERDLRQVFGNISDAALTSGISRSLRSKDFVKLRRGYYIFGERLNRGKISKFTVANHIYSPSYVSFESALSHHGFIPESVYVVTSASPRREEKIYETPLGDFSYNYIPKGPFFMGVDSKWGSLLANPLKALLDLIYLRRKSYEGIHQLEEDLRIEIELLLEWIKMYSFQEMETLALSYKKKNVERFFQILMRASK